MGESIAVLITVAVGSIWRWFSKRHSAKARKIASWESRLRDYAAAAFAGVEVLAQTTGWGPAEKLLEYKTRVSEYLLGAEIPTDVRSLEQTLEGWAATWAKHEKDIRVPLAPLRRRK